MPADDREPSEPSAPKLPASWGVDPRATIEERAQRAIAARELEMDFQKLRSHAWLAPVAWTVFGFYDILQERYLGAGSLRELLIIRGVVAIVLAAVAIWARVDPKPTQAKISAALIAANAALTAGFAAMCIFTGGFDSIYAAGILLTTTTLGIVPRPFRIGVGWMFLSLAPYPLILFGSTFIVPAMREQLSDPHVMSTAIQAHFVGLVWLIVFPLIAHSMWSTRRALYESQSVGQYRLTRLLGRGGMGEVWAAHHRGLRRDVAVKILQRHNEQNENATRRFEREIHAMTGLTHPNTVRLYDFGVAEDGRLYYAMELLEGETLRDLVARVGPLPVERAVHLIAQAAEALGEAHESGIVHRDVKPENIFLTTVGGRSDFVKVFDFGIASVLDDPRFPATRTGVVAGTPGTMSPEVIVGDPATPSSDVYALGAVFYLLLTGELPFGSGNPALRAHIDERPVVPSERLGTPIPASVEGIVLRCLSKEPDRRYATGTDLARALMECEVPAWDRTTALTAPDRPIDPADAEMSDDGAQTKTMGRHDPAVKRRDRIG